MKRALDIVIINWNSGDQLKNCLDSIVETDKDNFILERVVVVDNASSDGSSDYLDFNLPLEIIRNPQNRGFGVACNQGAKESDADYILFFNPDACLYKDSLTKCVAFMDKIENSGVGILGIQLLDQYGIISRTCARFPTLSRFLSKMIGADKIFPRHCRSHFMTEWDHKQSREIDHVIGAFFFVRNNLFKNLGGFDELFFVYLEDLDFSCRARQAGWKSFYLTEAQAFHKGGGTSDQIKATRLFYSLRSRIQYSYKHFNALEALTVLVGTLSIEFLARILFAIGKLSLSDLSETFQGYQKLWVNLPRMGYDRWRDPL
ncbi:glycosyltransferase family 2 protein [Sporomusa sp.]|uniref:glycosyltransferase family 2 protein n=1 Tax=Sporomusa sp. TaxID=2078658 RepID=UPI002CAC36E4|nr:glycosyltransferase family 2 protein [Sporomusa sp.]HWR45834.1 glycosyltransferase family 2 protein [Sporomusa sp.]